MPTQEQNKFLEALRETKKQHARNQSTYVDLRSMLSEDFNDFAVPENFLHMLYEIEELVKEFKNKAKTKIQEEADCVNQLAESHGYIEAGNEAVVLATGHNSI